MLMEGFRDKLASALESAEDLPTLPEMVWELEAAMQSQTSGADEVAFIIEQDPSLTANVLRVVNSVYYLHSASGMVNSVQHAVARMGFREISRMITTLTFIDTFAGMGQHLNHKDLWNHNLMVGISTRVINWFSTCSKLFSDDEAYVAGLLHDTGKLVLDQYFPDIFCQVREATEERDSDWAETERSILEIDHGEIGGYLLELWNLPTTLVEAVTWHHQPDRSGPDSRLLAQEVLLADVLCKGLDAGLTDEILANELPEGPLRDLGVSADKIPVIVNEVSKEARYCAALVSAA